MAAPTANEEISFPIFHSTKWHFSTTLKPIFRGSRQNIFVTEKWNPLVNMQNLTPNIMRVVERKIEANGVAKNDELRFSEKNFLIANN